jgi:DNA-directed RNA polymerase specialized sigma24 family protein
MSRPIELETLLREERWVRRLARRLVVDPNEAEDLVQEAWLARLSAPPGERGLSRAWTNSVLRNLWRDLLRGHERREVRERAAARAEGGPPQDELAAELELRQRVGACLLGGTWPSGLSRSRGRRTGARQPWRS